MNADTRGGASAGDNLEDRLSGRFAAELDRAERDYPALREKLVESVPAARARRGLWPRIALPITSAAVLAIAVLAGAGLLSGSTTGPGVGSVPSVTSGPASSGVVMGADGIPTQIDGQHVYRVTDQASFPTSGSFLLAGYGLDFVMACPTGLPQPSAEVDLLGQCGGVELAPHANENPGPGLLMLAPQGSSLVGWLGGPAIVVRVHTHDPEAAQCSSSEQSACEAALVVEAVVWPTVPTQIDGERVYRAADQASFPTSGSFLLGGPFTKPEFMPPCPMQANETTAEQQLIPYCYILSIDGLELTPMSNIDEPNGEIVVARVHIDDPLAAQCPASDREECQAGIVVESVVWHGAKPVTSASPTPGETGSLNPVSAVSAGPITSVSTGPVASTGSGATGSGAVIGPDGVPTALDGQKVYRAADLPSSPIFLLGGKLTLDTACAAPTTPQAQPSACGYWMIDGVRAVGTTNIVPEFLFGQPVVAQVELGRALAVCPGGSCTKDTLVILSILWPLPSVTTPPPPLAPSPS